MPTFIDTTLRSMAEEGYAAFSKKLTPTAYEILGVRLPVLRKFMKGLPQDVAAEALEAQTFESYEAVMVTGFLIGRINDPNEVIARIDRLLPHMDNWAHIDCITASLKAVNKNRELFFEHYAPLRSDPGEFNKRFLAVLLMDYFLTDDYVERVLSLYETTVQGQYYTDMGLAWGLSVLLIKYYDRTLPYFTGGKFSVFVHNKAIQKAIESYRVSDEKKAYLRSLKIKNA